MDQEVRLTSAFSCLPPVGCAGRAARTSEVAYRPESAMPIMREGDHRHTPVPCGEVPIQGLKSQVRVIVSVSDLTGAPPRVWLSPLCTLGPSQANIRATGLCPPRPPGTFCFRSQPPLKIGKVKSV